MSNILWPKSSLNSLCTRIGDGVHGTPKYVEYSDYPFINGNNLKQGYISIFSDTKKVSRTEYEKYFIQFDANTLFLSINGTLGSLAKYRGETVVLGKSVAYINCSKVNVDFLYYYLQLESVQKQMWNVATGSTIKNLSLASIRNLQIPTPSTLEQNKIAAVLTALDAKIDCNNRINAELETMIKTLYEYWFVQFNFPDVNGRPYKSSGGIMVWNEELKRDIPEGWEVLQLSKKLTFEKGVEPGSAEYSEHKESIHHVKFIRVGDVDGGSNIFIDTRLKNYAIVSERDVLVTFDGSVGKVAFGLEGAYSGGLRRIYDRSGSLDSSLIYFIFKDERINKTIHKYATGSILLHAGSSIDVLKIPYCENIYLEFQSIIKESYRKMVLNKNENRHISELREWLLPMLMNGQVSVK